MKGMVQALNLKPYPAYKDSGILGAGSIPPNWEAERLKGHVENVVNPTRQRDPEETYIALEHVESWTGKIRDAGDDVNFESQVKRFQERDVLFGKLRPYLAKVTAPNRSSGVCAGEFLVLRPLGHHLATKFLERFLRSKPIIDAVDASTFGAKMPRADWNFIGNMEMPVPPLSEQAAIVRFLDHVDEQMGHYIAAKERLIALLEEQRQALIHQAVTRGLDPGVRLKESRVDWLGDIPEHWDMRRSKRLFSPRQELAKPNDVQLSATQAYGVIPQDEYEQRVGRRVVKISLHLDKRQHVEVDDFVISMRSFEGGLERAWATGCIRSSYVVLRPTNEVDVEFFSYVLKFPAYIQALQSTANFIRDGQDLNFNNFCAVDLPLPPTNEQKKTAVALSEATTNIDGDIARARRQIDLMNEYRTRLIADVVTGQLDVREATERLPTGHQETNLANDIVITQEVSEL